MYSTATQESIDMAVQAVKNGDEKAADFLRLHLSALLSSGGVDGRLLVKMYDVLSESRRCPSGKCDR